MGFVASIYAGDSIGFPDYSNGSNITTDFNNKRSNGYTISENGWIYVVPFSTGKFYINDTLVCNQSDAGLIHQGFLPVKKGDVLTANANVTITFFPMK